MLLTNRPSPLPVARSTAFAASLLALGLGIACAAAPAAARPGGVPANLGGGLGQLVERYNVNRGALDRTAPRFGADYTRLAIFDKQQRVQVAIHLKRGWPLAEFKRTVQGRNDLKDLRITAESDRTRAAIVEAFVPVAAVSKLAGLRSVSAVHLVPRPVTDVGATTSQGVVQHRVDQLPAGIDGSGITVGVLSDSYNTSTNPVKAANDIATGDLPGPGNPLGNTEPVVILEELDDVGIDEGRAMLQIIHDLAPKAKLCFATAFTGQVGFANNIRGLADPTLGCGASVIVDDIIYLDEPFFTDGIIAQAVDDVAALGVPYFSSAGNRPSTQAYLSDLKLVAPTTSSLAGTNIKLTGVDPALYAGGFHNFNPRGLDIAQPISLSGGGTISFQWDDPYDAPIEEGPELLSTAGEITTAQPVADIPFAGTAGQAIKITADGVPSGDLDIVLTFIAPDGTVLATIDTGTSPETYAATLAQTGTYTIRITGFEGDTGPFTVVVNEVSGSVPVTSDFNLLFFDTNGNFLFASATDNIAGNRPLELFDIGGTGTLQMVIARANTPPPSPTPASKLRYVWFTSGSPTEYFAYDYPVTFGHNSAAGGNGVAAYAFYAPFIPEGFTSPGPVTIFFDTEGNRLPTPEVRQKPDMAAMDGANTTFFTSDTSADPDTFPNFFGTSAAAPHAAAIAALVLQKNGGPFSLTPAQMRTILQQSAFPHDLDPYLASGVAVAGATRISFRAVGDGSFTSQVDPNFFRVGVAGLGTVSGFTLDGTTGNPTGASADPGLVFDSRTAATSPPGFPFTVGNVRGLSASDVTGTLGPTPPSPAVAGQSSTLAVTLTPGVFGGGDFFTFGIDRDELPTAFSPPSAAGGNSADLLGDGVLIPQGTVAAGGVTFSGSLGSGQSFSGVFTNQIGAGYTPLDGFGFINAEAAVNAPLP
ncbi:S8 family serine peptidase [Gloeobacter violaceus]|uniref:Glr3160 protein n=1 Tax=Gloeobacter violaceus (strain ATCC 29082 / PCC 7421) TaxID=251221 RepID=Q7NGK9_GLOVI|nr:S8 family serine peptidase [Gloeobacter violaceus]BAC91101.1 glr3160 [Gloeobacter violaceus PCC 7421]